MYRVHCVNAFIAFIALVAFVALIALFALIALIAFIELIEFIAFIAFIALIEFIGLGEGFVYYRDGFNNEILSSVDGTFYVIIINRGCYSYKGGIGYQTIQVNNH